MCGRFAFADIMDNIEARMILDDAMRQMPLFSAKEIFPSAPAPVIIPAGTDPSLLHNSLLPGNVYMFDWGYKLDKKRIINARSETVFEKPFFSRDYFAGRRCLVPATAYFEWMPVENRKVKFSIRPEDGSLIYFAGLYNVEQQLDKSIKHNFVILTKPALQSISYIHDRMPVILSGAGLDEWLDGDGVRVINDDSLNDLVAVRA
ncbi:MAG: SOS response-associated peptidase [Bacillota bacterium]